MTLSARNHLKGTIDEIQLGDVLAHVTVRVGENVIESVITRRSAEEMSLKKGDVVVQKVLSRLDRHARTFIEAAPFVLVGTASPDGTADVSPKGGPAGFVVVLDDQRLAIPDLAGESSITAKY